MSLCSRRRSPSPVSISDITCITFLQLERQTWRCCVPRRAPQWAHLPAIRDYDKKPETGYWCSTPSSGNDMAATFLRSEQLYTLLTSLELTEEEKGKVLRPPPTSLTPVPPQLHVEGPLKGGFQCRSHPRWAGFLVAQLSMNPSSC